MCVCIYVYICTQFLLSNFNYVLAVLDFIIISLGKKNMSKVKKEVLFPHIHKNISTKILIFIANWLPILEIVFDLSRIKRFCKSFFTGFSLRFRHVGCPFQIEQDVLLSSLNMVKYLLRYQSFPIWFFPAFQVPGFKDKYQKFSIFTSALLGVHWCCRSESHRLSTGNGVPVCSL